MKFVIPSFGRISELKEKSLKFLKKYDIDLKDIYIFVREDDNQLCLYESMDDINIVICDVKGIGRTHNFITEYFEEGEIIIELDDDLTKMVDKNKEEITDLKGEKGGCNADGRNNESEKIDKEFLSNKYPQFCKLFQRKSGIWDLRLKAYKQKPMKV